MFWWIKYLNEHFPEDEDYSQYRNEHWGEDNIWTRQFNQERDVWQIQSKQNIFESKFSPISPTAPASMEGIRLTVYPSLVYLNMGLNMDLNMYLTIIPMMKMQNNTGVPQHGRDEKTKQCFFIFYAFGCWFVWLWKKTRNMSFFVICAKILWYHILAVSAESSRTFGLW